MDMAVRLFHRPEFIVPILAIHADLALSLLAWHSEGRNGIFSCYSYARTMSDQ